jgi:predicted TIM-barrel fold metal-dependent hydrolase
VADLKTIDMNAYVAPGIELIYERAPGEFRGQWENLQQYLTVARPQAPLGDRATSHLALTVEGRRPKVAIWDDPARLTWAGSARPIEPGVLHDNAAGRLRAMDERGVDVQLLSPGSTIIATRWLPSNLAAGVLGAYNQYVLAYCSEDARRLKAVVQLHGGEPEWSAAELRELASHEAVAAATLWLPAKVAPDDRRFVPIWRVLEETGVPLLHRPTVCTPVWDPRRMVAFLAYTGILDRFPSIRIAFGETGLDWVGDWLDHVDQTAPGAHVRRHAAAGRIFATVGADDDAGTIARAAAQLGDHALLWQSHFPYREVDAPPADQIDYARNALAFLDGVAPTLQATPG